MVLQKTNRRISKLTALVTIILFILFTIVVLTARNKSQKRHRSEKQATELEFKANKEK